MNDKADLAFKYKMKCFDIICCYLLVQIKLYRFDAEINMAVCYAVFESAKFMFGDYNKVNYGPKCIISWLSGDYALICI